VTRPPAVVRAERHVLLVWDPARQPDAMEETLRLLLSLARSRDSLEAGEDDVYVWWGKIRSPNRQQPLPHLGDVLALDAALRGDAAGDGDATLDDAREVHLDLTDYRSLYVGHVAEVAAGDPRDDDEMHVPRSLYPSGVSCDCWFRLFDVRRLVHDDTPGVVEELKKLRNTRYHDRPVSLYGGMVELPLLVTREDGARWFDHATRAGLTDGHLWVELDAELSGVGAVAATLRDDVLGEATWRALDPAARLFIATAEKIYRDHRSDPAFDFSPVVVNFAKAYEVQLSQVFGRIQRRLPRDAGFVNVDGKTVDALAERMPGIGVLARVLGESHALRAAVPRWLANHAWVNGSLPAILKELGALRNPAAHSEAVSRESARRLRDAQLGVGCLGALVELGRVRVIG
jgi:hypothetical protein